MVPSQSLLSSLVVALLICSGIATYTERSIRRKFEEDFHSRCDKYPFVQKWYDRLENPSDRFLVFSFHEPNLRNGGIGDRIGGMISAFAMAMRFNRTLVLKSSNGFFDYFRPYHPVDINSTKPKYLWKNGADWTGYKPVGEQVEYLRDNLDMEELDELEYDLKDCVSNEEIGFSEEMTQTCSMASGDAPQQVIRFLSNRAYLCRWDNRPQHAAFLEFKRVLLGDDTMNRLLASGSSRFLNDLGKDPAADLFEVSGCMMRLMMWPTEEMWRRADAVYDAYQSDLVKKYSSGPGGLAAILPPPPPAAPGATTGDSTEADEDEESSGSKKKGKKGKKGKKSKKSKKSKKRRASQDEDEAAAAVSPYANVTSVMEEEVFQLGMHMRCGDKHSYLKFKLNTDGYDRFACIVEKPNIEMRESSREHEKSIYLNAGNPLTIGQCGAAMYNEFEAALARDNRKRSRLHREAVKAGGLVGLDGSVTPVPATPPVPRSALRSSFVFITSDNIMAANQMNTTMGHPHTFITPQGCHIELDPTQECFAHTVTYWFMLTLSDVLVTQTFGEFNAPTSSFSRYAGIYGLKRDPFRSGRYCQERFNSAIISHMEQSNWFC